MHLIKNQPLLQQSEIHYLLRKRAGLTQKEYSKKKFLNRNHISLIELGLRDPSKEEKLLSDVTLPEYCVLLRRRAKKTQRDLAKILGVSRVWINKMERGSAPISLLYNYWEQ